GGRKMPGQAVVTIGARQWSVALATTLEELTQGLGGLASIAPGTGMLFDLGQDQVAAVTTAPMLFPIDIIWIRSASGVAEVALGVQPGFLVTPTAPVRFFLEVNAGEAEGVQAGDSALIEPQEAAAVDNGGVASIVNFGVAMGTLALVMGMLGTVVRPVMPRPKRPALHGPSGELLPATEKTPRKEYFFDAGEGEHVSIVAPDEATARERAEEGFRQMGLARKLGRLVRVSGAPPPIVRFIGACKVGGNWCQTHDKPVSKLLRCPASELTDEEWRMAWEVAEQAFPGGQQPPGGLVLLPQVEAVPVEGWRPRSMQEVDAAVAKYANAMRRGLQNYRSNVARMVVKYEGSVEKAIHYYRRYVIGEYERGRERPMLAPAVIGPRERRQAPEGLEYFADSAEQLLASTNPYRAQTDAAFREAIERVRGPGFEAPKLAREMSR
ncbi:MAG: DUF192 domain-containing protein, partial [Chloroflexota bacterium]|nr:DUF192 domain-containing protein [Chloroflexota bacterium]